MFHFDNGKRKKSLQSKFFKKIMAWILLIPQTIHWYSMVWILIVKVKLLHRLQTDVETYTFCLKNTLLRYICLINPIQDGPFRGCSWIGGGGGEGGKKPPSLKSVTHILQIWHSYSLPKEDISITWYISWVLPTLAFFPRKSANFAISRNTDIDCILIHNF